MDFILGKNFLLESCQALEQVIQLSSETTVLESVEKNLWVWHLVLWFSNEHSGAVLTDGLDDPRILFQPNHFYEFKCSIRKVINSYQEPLYPYLRKLKYIKVRSETEFVPPSTSNALKKPLMLKVQVLLNYHPHQNNLILPGTDFQICCS